MATARGERDLHESDLESIGREQTRGGDVSRVRRRTAFVSVDHPRIPDIVIRRLPIYIRTLGTLADQGARTVSSEELAELIGVTAAQIRRDLSYFGKFGKQGKGYDVSHLSAAIGGILNLDRQWDVALVGFGNLGRAILHFRGFLPSSFRIAAIFDRNPERVGQQVDELIVKSDDQITAEVARLGIQMGILAVPVEAAQSAANRLVAGGVRAILSYTPVILKVPPEVVVREIDPVGAMQSMTYYLDDGTA
jgi:redox-sensing transcriptional repressor